MSGVYLVGCMALVAQATVLLSSGGQAAQLAVLVHWVHDPVDAGVLQTENTVSMCAAMIPHEWHSRSLRPSGVHNTHLQPDTAD